MKLRERNTLCHRISAGDSTVIMNQTIPFRGCLFNVIHAGEFTMRSTGGSMKKLPGKQPEKRCVACNGTGHEVMVTNPKKPTVRIYPRQCKVCLGKGRVAI
jgi:DnaJ-class molecular chaperone